MSFKRAKLILKVKWWRFATRNIKFTVASPPEYDIRCLWYWERGLQRDMPRVNRLSDFHYVLSHFSVLTIMWFQSRYPKDYIDNNYLMVQKARLLGEPIIS